MDGTAKRDLQLGKIEGPAASSHLSIDPLFATVIPSKLFEAVGMGIPVILSLPEGESSEIVRQGGIGVVVHPESSTDLAREIIALRSDPTRLAAYRAACSEQAPLFSGESLAQDMVRVFRQVVSNAGTVA